MFDWGDSGIPTDWVKDDNDQILHTGESITGQRELRVIELGTYQTKNSRTEIVS